MYYQITVPGFGAQRGVWKKCVLLGCELSFHIVCLIQNECTKPLRCMQWPFLTNSRVLITAGAKRQHPQCWNHIGLCSASPLRCCQWRLIRCLHDLSQEGGWANYPNQLTTAISWLDVIARGEVLRPNFSFVHRNIRSSFRSRDLHFHALCLPPYAVDMEANLHY